MGEALVINDAELRRTVRATIISAEEPAVPGNLARIAGPAQSPTVISTRLANALSAEWACGLETPNPARGGLRKCLSALIFLGCGGPIRTLVAYRTADQAGIRTG